MDCLCPAALSLQQILRWWKAPGGSRICDYEAAPICPQRASSTQSSWLGSFYQAHTTMSPVPALLSILTHKLLVVQTWKNMVSMMSESFKFVGITDLSPSSYITVLSISEEDMSCFMSRKCSAEILNPNPTTSAC